MAELTSGPPQWEAVKFHQVEGDSAHPKSPGTQRLVAHIARFRAVLILEYLFDFE